MAKWNVMRIPMKGAQILNFTMLWLQALLACLVVTLALAALVKLGMPLASTMGAAFAVLGVVAGAWPLFVKWFVVPDWGELA